MAEIDNNAEYSCETIKSNDKHLTIWQHGP